MCLATCNSLLPTNITLHNNPDCLAVPDQEKAVGRLDDLVGVADNGGVHVIDRGKRSLAVVHDVFVT